MPEAERHGPRHLVVGHLVKAHGTRGELFARPLTDHPGDEGPFGVVVLLGGASEDEPDPDLPPLRIESVRPFRDGFLVSFAGVDDRNQSELLRGFYLYRDIEELEPLAEGEFFLHQLLGVEVTTVDGTRLGEVTQFFELQPADLLEVRGEGKEYMIPLLEDIVVELDTDEGRLVIDPPEGLLEL